MNKNRIRKFFESSTWTNIWTRFVAALVLIGVGLYFGGNFVIDNPETYNLRPVSQENQDLSLHYEHWVKIYTSLNKKDNTWQWSYETSDGLDRVVSMMDPNYAIARDVMSGTMAGDTVGYSYGIDFVFNDGKIVNTQFGIDKDHPGEFSYLFPAEMQRNNHETLVKYSTDWWLHKAAQLVRAPIDAFKEWALAKEKNKEFYLESQRMALYTGSEAESMEAYDIKHAWTNAQQFLNSTSMKVSQLIDQVYQEFVMPMRVLSPAYHAENIVNMIREGAPFEDLKWEYFLYMMAWSMTLASYALLAAVGVIFVIVRDRM